MVGGKVLSPEQKLARRLVSAAGRIQISVYAEPTTLAEAAFRLDWSDALISLAEQLVQSPDEKGGDSQSESTQPSKNQ